MLEGKETQMICVSLPSKFFPPFFWHQDTQRIRAFLARPTNYASESVITQNNLKF